MHWAGSIYFHVIIFVPGESRWIVGVLIAGISPLFSYEDGKVLCQLSPQPATEGAIPLDDLQKEVGCRLSMCLCLYG